MNGTIDTYSVRELEAHFSDIKGTLFEIKEQVKKTNGRVSRLENWRYFITGGIAIISIIVIPLVVYSFNQKVEAVAYQCDFLK